MNYASALHSMVLYNAASHLLMENNIHSLVVAIGFILCAFVGSPLIAHLSEFVTFLCNLCLKSVVGTPKSLFMSQKRSWIKSHKYLQLVTEAIT